MKLSATAKMAIGFVAIELINKQIAEGVDESGKQFTYSTRPFARPVGGSRIKRIAGLEKEGKLKRFKTKEGKLWMVVTGGYKSLREMRGKNPDGDFLQDTGQLLRSLVPSASGDNEIVVKFSNQKAAQLAFWLTVSGAGKSRKMWKFLGLTPANQSELIERTASYILADSLTDFKLPPIS